MLCHSGIVPMVSNQLPDLDSILVDEVENPKPNPGSETQQNTAKKRSALSDSSKRRLRSHLPTGNAKGLPVSPAALRDLSPHVLC